jgi:hypothetical protein
LWRGGGEILIESPHCEVVGLSDAVSIGRAMKRVLDVSPLLDPDDPIDGMSADEFNGRLAAYFGLNPKRSPYAGMKSCSVDRALDEIELRPLRREHGGRFTGFTGIWAKEHQNIVVPNDIDDEGLGLAVQECVRRCL